MKKLKNVSVLMNEIEQSEKRKDSVLLKDIVVALPDEKEISLEDKIELTKSLIEKRGWIKEGLAVQVDIHQPHDGEKNWHAHLLVSTRRIREDGLGFHHLKAVDLEPQIRGGKARIVVKEGEQIHEDWRGIQNEFFKERGLEIKVDAIGITPQEHIGPIRMRSVLNKVAMHNEEVREANLNLLRDANIVLSEVTKRTSVFTKKDLNRIVKPLSSKEREVVIARVMDSGDILPLLDKEGDNTAFIYH